MKTSVPEPIWATFIAPPIVLAKSVPEATVFVRLKASVAPAEPVIALDVESEPVVPLLPIWSVPAFTLVVPV